MIRQSLTLNREVRNTRLVEPLSQRQQCRDGRQSLSTFPLADEALRELLAGQILLGHTQRRMRLPISPIRESPGSRRARHFNTVRIDLAGGN